MVSVLVIVGGGSGCRKYRSYITIVVYQHYKLVVIATTYHITFITACDCYLYQDCFFVITYECSIASYPWVGEYPEKTSVPSAAEDSDVAFRIEPLGNDYIAVKDGLAAQ